MQKRHMTAAIFFIFVAAAFTGCTRATNSSTNDSKVAFALPSREELQSLARKARQSEKAELAQMADPVTTNPATNPTNPPTNGVTSPSAGAKVRGWPLSKITALEQIECYLVTVDVPAVVDNACTDSSGAVVASPSVVKGFVAPGSAVELEVTSGAARRFSIFGVSKLVGAGCSDFSAADFSRTGFSAPVLISQVTTDLEPGTKQLDMPLKVKDASVQSCKGPLFPKAWQPRVTPEGALADVVFSKSTFVPSLTTVTVGSPVTAILKLFDVYGDTVLVPGLPIAWSTDGSAGSFTGAAENAADGSYSVQWTSGIASAGVHLKAMIAGQTITTGNSVMVAQGSLSLVQSDVSASMLTVAAGDNSGIVILTARDAAGNPITTGGETVTFFIASGTGYGSFGTVTDIKNGTYSATFYPSGLGTVQVGARVNGQDVTSLRPSITIVSGAVSQNTSVATISSSTVGGGATATVSLQLRDAASNNVADAGRAITFGIDNGTSTGSFSAPTYMGNGLYTATFTAGTAGTQSRITGYIDGQPASVYTVVTVTGGTPDPANSILGVNMSSVAAGSTATVSVLVRDSAGNPLPSASPTFSPSLSGGTSTGTFGSFANNGAGSFTSTFTGETAGSMTTINVSMNGQQLTLGGAQIQVTPGPISVQSTVGVGAGTVVSGSPLTLTLNAKDTYLNPLTAGGATVTFAKFSGTGDGTFGSTTDLGNGQYTVAFTGTTAGILSVQASVNGTAISSTPSVTVSPGPPVSSTLTGPASIPAGDCASYMVTLVDASGNTTSSTSSFTLGFSGYMSGSFYTDVGCTSSTTTQYFNAGQSTATMYYKNNTVQSLSMTGNAGSPAITGAAKSVDITASVAWLGAYGSTFTRMGAPRIPAGARLEDTFLNPTGVFVDSSGATYVSDRLNSRILKFDPSGSFVGWYGQIAESPTGGGAGCVAAMVGSITPGWCTGGLAARNGSAANAIGYIASPGAITGDGTYIYIVNNPVYRVERLNASTGAYAGWIGQIGSATGNDCGGSNSSPTPMWCKGGSSTSGTVDGAFTNPRGIAYASGYIYVTDATQYRVQRFDSSGIFRGWIGYINNVTGIGGSTECSSASASTITPNWCTGGAAGTTTGDGFGTGLYGIAADTGYLYVSTASKLLKFQLTGEFVGWTGWVSTPPTAGAGDCNGHAAGSATTYWCKGGTASNNTSMNGGLSNQSYLAVDSGYIYVTDSSLQRISRFTTNGAFQGAIGRVTSTPTDSISSSGCSSVTIDTPANKWCKIGGGNSAVFTENGAFGMTMDSGIAFDGSNLVIADTLNNRLVRVNASSGAFADWSGGAAIEIQGWQRMPQMPIVTSSVPSAFSQNFDSQGYGTEPRAVSPYLLSSSLYVPDRGSGSLKLFDLGTGIFQGWRGGAVRNPTGGPGTCTSTGLSQATPNFCTGGASINLPNATLDGTFNAPAGATSDGTYYYVVDMYRIQRFLISTGAADGWIGKIGNITGINTCASPSVGTFSQGWCKGGNATTGIDDGMIAQGAALLFDSASGTPTLYVADSVNNRVLKYNATTGAFLGWIGRISTSPTGGSPGCNGATGATPGWCVGGQPNITGATGISQFTKPMSLAADTTYLYVGDNARVARFSLVDGTFGGWIGSNAGTLTSGWMMTAGSPATGPLEGGFAGPYRGMVIYGGYLYVSDSDPTKNVIQRYDLSTGAFQGWKGTVALQPTGGESGCNTTAQGQFTPGWCTGGKPGRPPPGAVGFDQAVGLQADANYLYLMDAGNSRILRVPR